ncbi:MAG: hypothetical protein IPJ37_09720 [Bacteroidales bacterium]|nr:hypothetical protein [Bacteroidales bacterium]
MTACATLRGKQARVNEILFYPGTDKLIKKSSTLTFAFFRQHGQLPGKRAGKSSKLQRSKIQNI